MLYWLYKDEKVGYEESSSSSVAVAAERKGTLVFCSQVQQQKNGERFRMRGTANKAKSLKLQTIANNGILLLP